MKSILFLLILTLIFSQAAFSQSQWYWLQPLPTGATLNSVDFIDRNTGYACGKAGTITKTTNGGLNWVLVGQITTADLNDIECIDINTCITVGNSGVIFKTTNGGLNWESISSGVSGILYGISFPTTTIGYISGTNGTLLKTTNGGNNWTFINVGVTSTLFDVSFINAQKGAMAGINNIYTTTNGGLNWTIHQLGTFFDYFRKIQYVNDSTIYGLFLPLSADRIFVSQNSGMTWNSYVIENLVPSEFSRSIKFKDENTGFAVTNFGNIHKTTNGGINWSRDTTFTPDNIDTDVFWDVNFIDTSNFYAVGSGGFIVRTTNTGEIWEKQTGVHQTYNDIYFTNDNTGYVVGERGILNKTTDAGISWNRINLNTSLDLKRIVFTNENTGYLCGDSGLVKKTTNRGINWISQTTPAADTNLLTIYFINENTGFISVFPRSILKTTNGGNDWLRILYMPWADVAHILDFNFLNTENGIASGDNGFLITTNGGNSWTRVVQSSIRFSSVEYLDSINIISGGQSGGNPMLKKSTDGGMSWFNVSISHIVTSLYFQNNQYGVACGDNGYVSRTTNGGLNWISQPRIATENLNSIFFTNPNSGYSVGYSGQIIKTTNGGLSFITKSDNFKVKEFSLFQNYPNPFNPKTIIEYSLKKSANVKIILYNSIGKEIKTLVNNRQFSGKHSVEFISNENSSGVYFYSLFVDNAKIDTKKFVLLK